MATESLSEQVARLERTLADVTRERDKWMAEAMARDELAEKRGKMLSAAESRLADAERRGRIEGFVDGAGWLHGEVHRLGLYRENVAVPEPGSVVRVMGHSARDEARRRYPHVPPEREGAELPPHEPDLGRTGNPAQWCERCRIEASRPTPPVEGAQECKVVEYDGAFKCLTHKRKWGAISNPDQPCRPTPPQAAPEPPRVVPLKVVAAFIAPINSSRWQGGLVNVTEDGAWWGYADVAGEWQRIVCPLASRPTASGEG